MPMCLLHCVEDVIDKRLRDLFVKEVAHGIHENALRLLPGERLEQALGPQCEIEPAFEWMSHDSAEALRKPFRIAIVAAGADLRAAGYGIPSRVGPLDGCAC